MGGLLGSLPNNLKAEVIRMMEEKEKELLEQLLYLRQRAQEIFSNVEGDDPIIYWEAAERLWESLKAEILKLLLD
jgi:hypothetical protein